MRDDIILIAIDEALGATDRCTCGHEYHLAERDDTLWLECPAFAGASRLPARVAFFLRELAHDRRPVAALPSRPAAVPSVAAVPIAANRPVSVHG